MTTINSQPYISWKSASTNSVVPSFSRPVLTVSGPLFKANPIKHWRKQLIPTENSGGLRAGVGIPFNVPGGSSYLGDTTTNTSCLLNTTEDSVGIKENIVRFNNTIFTSLPSDKFYDISNNKMVCVACNPETMIIKPATTILSKKYYTDTKGYMKSRGVSFNQNLTVNPNCSPEQCTSINQPVYNPSNTTFSKQGAVDSSSRIALLKLNTINKTASSYKSTFGTTASKYNGSSNTPYFLKSKNQAPVSFKYPTSV